MAVNTWLMMFTKDIDAFQVLTTSAAHGMAMNTARPTFNLLPHLLIP